MPLDPSKTDEAISKNISELRNTGRPQDQAIAIAMRVAGKPKPVGVKQPKTKVGVKKE